MLKIVRRPVCGIQHDRHVKSKVKLEDRVL